MLGFCLTSCGKASDWIGWIGSIFVATPFQHWSATGNQAEGKFAPPHEISGNAIAHLHLGTLRSCLLSIQIRETLTYNVVHLLHHFVWHYLNLRWCIGPETDNRSESYVCKGPKKILVSFDFDLFWEWCEGKRDSFSFFKKRTRVKIQKEKGVKSKFQKRGRRFPQPCPLHTYESDA